MQKDIYFPTFSLPTIRYKLLLLQDKLQRLSVDNDIDDDSLAVIQSQTSVGTSDEESSYTPTRPRNKD